MTSTKLGSATLASLPPGVRVPAYDRSEVQQHTVHLGVGGFHRAHQAVYLDDLLHLSGTPRWGECGIGVLASDDRMRDALHGQDCLYTVVERSADVQSARVIGSLVDFIYAPADREVAIERMAAPATRIVSLTITEGGYFIDEGTGEFVAAHPAIQHDVNNPASASTWLGLVTEALHRRRQRGLPAFTLMSCDNLQGNGHVTQKVLMAFAGLTKPSLQSWIASNVAFPNSMVDRITPATTAADLAFVRERFGIVDAWPVVTEPFRQWVIEDAFSNGRPAWEDVGAEIIADVAPYEIMKMRLLNGSHLAMAYLGALAGIPLVHEVMQDGTFYEFIERFMEEVTPIVPIIQGTDVRAYKRTLLERFLNPTINDQVTRICSEGSAKLPKWLLPSIVELMDKGVPRGLLTLVVASWIFYLGRGVDKQGKPLDIIDARAAELGSIARQSLMDPTPMLVIRSIFGERLSSDLHFRKAVAAALRTLAEHGVRAAMRQYLAGTV